MATQGENEKVQALLADLRNAIVDQNPELAEAVDQYIDQMFRTVADEESGAAPDAGFSRLIGFGPDAARYLNQTRIPSRVEEYDETVTAERINAVGDLYYIFQHEKLGVFRVMQKLKELFEAGTLRLSSGDGAFWLYQFDKRGVLRYTRRDRFAAYRRVLGYGSAPVAAGAVPNTDFHRLMTHFVNEVVQFWRDKRISDVIRTGADDPSFGSIATVRRAGLDLRNNLKWASYGHVNVLRVEVMQLLDEAFRILNAPDMRQQFGADNAWDVIEEVLSRYFNEQPNSSSRQRMAVTGRDIIRWLASRHILRSGRTQFEGLLREIGDDAEEWITSAETVGVARRAVNRRGLPFDRARSGPNGRALDGQRAPTSGAAEYELEAEF